MFGELVSRAQYISREFTDNVRDAFGNDIEAGLLEPLLGELCALALLEDDTRQTIRQLDNILFEIRSMNPIN